MTRNEWTRKVMKGTSGDMVFDILRDWGVSDDLEELAATKLNQILSEMQNPKFYYNQPQRNSQVSCVMPGKQEEWISRLSMIREELQECTNCAFLYPTNEQTQPKCHWPIYQNGAKGKGRRKCDVVGDQK